MTTFTAYTEVNNNISAQKLVALASEMEPKPTGVGMVQLEDGSNDWEIGLYFSEEPNTIQLSILETIFDATFLVSKVLEKDWVSEVQRGLRPVKVGRFVIFGSHDSNSVSINEIGILIEAAMAFGTGHHASTVGCLKAFEYLLKARISIDSVADLGCGTGVLAIAAAKAGCSRVVASDIDPIACRTAKINIFKNGLSGKIFVIKADGFTNCFFRQRAPFDLAFANILARPLCSLAKQINKFLTHRGVVVLSGILNSQSNMVQNYFVNLGFKREKVLTVGVWTTLIMRKP